MEIDLADAVAALRDELLEAAQRSAGKTVTFAVGPIEMEFTVELKKDAKAKAGVKAWVLSGGAEAGITRGQTQKVKVTLTPKRPDGRDLLISAEAGTTPEPTAGSGHIGR